MEKVLEWRQEYSKLMGNKRETEKVLEWLEEEYKKYVVKYGA